MRCSVLAKHLQGFGAKILFVCRTMPGDLCNYLEEQHFSVYRLPSTSASCPKINGTHHNSPWSVPLSQEIRESEIALRNSGPFDWLVVDHYDLDEKWEEVMTYFAKHIFVIDDLASKPHRCDILLNHAYLPGLYEKYNSLGVSGTKLLLGPDYFILNPTFHNIELADRDGHIGRIFVFYGGADVTNETTKVVDAITNMHQCDFHVDVVISNQNPYKLEISKRISSLPNFTLHVQLPSLAELMHKSDISFGAGGGTTYERMFLGLPSIVTTIAENQVAVIRRMHEEKLVYWLGDADKVESTELLRAINQALENPERLREQSRMAMRVVDGKGLDRIEHLLASY
jgi:UDP-2,4-diacetamido-2,4,6-trideoxy-beta-L-altropyranose hydrolase